MLAAVVLPWTLRNYSVLDRFVLVSNAGWLNVRSGNTLVDPEWMRPDGYALEGFRNTYFAIPDEMERADYARDQGFALIRSEQPTWVFKKAVRSVALLGSPDSYLFKKISRGAYPSLSIEAIRTLLVLGAVSTSAILLLALPGLAAARGARGRGLVGGLVAVSFVVYLVANASSRYRFPWMPLAIVFAASTLVAPGRVVRSLRSMEWACVGVAAALYLGVAVPYFWPDAVSLWNQGNVPGARQAMRLRKNVLCRLGWVSTGLAASGSTILGLAACGREAPPPDRPQRIIVISMDTVRADHVSGFGTATTTPALAEIAAEGAVLRNFYAASTFTLPSHMSIFTGLDPMEHGVWREEAQLNPNVKTLAQALAEAGYRTAAFHEGGYVSPRYGFDRGFESYVELPRMDVVGGSLDRVIDWIRAHRGEDYFLFVHTYAAHYPLWRF